MVTVIQRCHRIDRLARELLSELKAHAYYDKDFKPAKRTAEETLKHITKVCEKKAKWY